jgi:hypothetical protein
MSRRKPIWENKSLKCDRLPDQRKTQIESSMVSTFLMALPLLIIICLCSCATDPDYTWGLLTDRYAECREVEKPKVVIKPHIRSRYCKNNNTIYWNGLYIEDLAFEMQNACGIKQE